jgi:hypothetical protein
MWSLFLYGSVILLALVMLFVGALVYFALTDTDDDDDYEDEEGWN